MMFSPSESDSSIDSHRDSSDAGLHSLDAAFDTVSSESGDYFSDDEGTTAKRAHARLSDSSNALDDLFVEPVKAKKQASIASFAVRKAEDPKQYERIMRRNAIADACKRASMPTKEELQERKRQKKKDQQNKRQEKRRIKLRLERSAKEVRGGVSKKSVNLVLGAANQLPALPAEECTDTEEPQQSGVKRKRGRPLGSKTQRRKARPRDKAPNAKRGKIVSSLSDLHCVALELMKCACHVVASQCAVEHIGTA
jgi:hypothetical protein